MSNRKRLAVSAAVTVRAGSRSDDGMEVKLRTPLPNSVEVGRGSVLWLEGGNRSKYRLRRIRVTTGDRSQELLAQNMPRPRPSRARDWWWAVMPIEPSEEERELTVEIDARVGLLGRRSQRIGTIRVRSDLERGRQTALALTNPPVGAMMGLTALHPTVAVCLPTQNPDIARFEQQFKSIQDQDYENFRCIIADDASNRDCLEEIERVIADDDRFELHRTKRFLGSYRNIERALSLAPAISPYVALAVQDDRWYPQKLSVLLATFEVSTLMVHSATLPEIGKPAVLDDAHDQWRERNRDCSDFRDLLFRSPITAGACMFRRELLTYALPFPPPQGKCDPDHWLSLVPRALGGVRFLDEPLFDRPDEGQGQGIASDDNDDDEPPPFRYGLSRRGRDLDERPSWRRDYVAHVAWGLVVGEVLRIRCWELMRAPDRRDLTRFLKALRAERFGVSAAWLILRSRSETRQGGVERLYLRGIAWKLGARLRGRFVRAEV